MREQVNTIPATLYGATLNATTLNAAISAIGSQSKVLLLTPGTWILNANVTVPRHVTLWIPHGAFVDATGGTLTVNGPMMPPPDALWYVGNVTFTYPQAEAGLPAHVLTGCQPLGFAGLTVTAFPCTGIVRDGPTVQPVAQGNASVTVPNAPTVWLALHRSTTASVAGWTRQSGTHYLVQASATKPTDPPGGLVFARVLVGGGPAITTIQPFAYRSVNDAQEQRHSVRSWGAVGNGTTDDRFPISVAEQAAAVLGSSLVFPPGTYAIASDFTIGQAMQFVPGALLKPTSSAVTLTINGRIHAGPVQIFDLSAGGVLRYNNNPVFSVLWTGADLTGQADSTAAFNAATQATRPDEATNVQPGVVVLNGFRTTIEVPSGAYLLLGPIYIRAGQHLKGAGIGSTIAVGNNGSAFDHMFHLGAGLIGGVLTVDGVSNAVFPCTLSGIHTVGHYNPAGGGIAYGIVHPMTAGSQIHNMWMTTAEIGIVFDEWRNTDSQFSDILIDFGSVGISYQSPSALTGPHQIQFTNVQLFLNNIGIHVNGFATDQLFTNLQTYFQEFVALQILAGSVMRNFQINNWNDVMNLQYGTRFATVHNAATDMELFVNGFTFSNHVGHAIVNVSAGESGIPSAKLYFSNGVVNGQSSLPGVWANSTTAGGFNVAHCELHLTNVHFKNLAASAIAVGGSTATRVYWRGGSVLNVNLPALTQLDITNTNTTALSELVLENIEGDRNRATGVLLYGHQPHVPVRHGGRVAYWTTTEGVASGRRYTTLPYARATVYEVTVTAIIDTANTDRRKSSTFLVSKQNGNASVGGGNHTVLGVSTVREDVADQWPVLDVDFDLGALGGGQIVLGHSNSGIIVVSVPDTYGLYQIEAVKLADSR